MELPRVRFTVQTLMLLVAVLAIGSWLLLYRRERFRNLTVYHHAEYGKA